MKKSLCRFRRKSRYPLTISSFGGSVRLTDCTLTLEFCYEAAWLLKRNTSEPWRILRLLGQLITTPQFSCWARTTKPEPFCERLPRREGTRPMYLEKRFTGSDSSCGESHIIPWRLPKGSAIEIRL